MIVEEENTDQHSGAGMVSLRITYLLWRRPNLPPFQGETFIELFPGLKPWAEGHSPFGAQNLSKLCLSAIR
jgi:hypothetical protein